MSFTDALLYSLSGMAVVFFALVLLMGICKIMIAVSDRVEKKASAPAAAPAAAPAPAAENRPLAPGAAGELKLYDTDPRTAAMLMAIVADELKAPLNELRFVSIREIKEDDEK